MQRSSRRALWLCVSFAALAALGIPSSARAQSEALAASRHALVEQARAAAAHGDHAQALEIAQRCLRIAPDAQVRLFIAEQHLALNHPTLALGNADLCLTEASREPVAATRRTLTERCNRVLVTARGRVGFVTVRIPDELRGRARVIVNGEALPNELVGAPAVVDPGTARVALVAQDGEHELRREIAVRASQRVELAFDQEDAMMLSSAMGRGSSARVAVARIDDDDAEIAAQLAATRAAEHRVVARDLPEPGPRVSAGPPVVLGIGAAALIFGGVSLALREQAYGDARAQGCYDDNGELACPSEASAERARGAALPNTLANVGFISGGVIVAAGAAWLVYELVRPRPAPQQAPQAAPQTERAPAPRPVPPPVITPSSIPLARGFALGVAGVF